MSELVVFKANELAVSRYDLTEHETKLILCCVALLNPSIENPTDDQRTVTFTYREYAKIMGLSPDNAYHRLNKITSALFKRSIEIIYPAGVIAKEVFNWVEYAQFNRDMQSLMLIFSKQILPYLFQLKKFIKYKLEHVKAFNNKYSMRIYEWLLKELTQRNTHKANIEISLNEFKFMLMLENKYPNYKNFNQDVLKPIAKDLNTYSNMKLAIEKRGRPADKLIFQVDLDKQIDLVTELAKDPAPTPDKSKKINHNAIKKDPKNRDEKLLGAVQKTRQQASALSIHLSFFEVRFLADIEHQYHLNGSFSWLTEKQRTTLENILTKYGNS